MLRVLSLMSFLLLLIVTTKSFADFAPDSRCGFSGCGYLLSGEITNLDAQAVRTMVQDRQTPKIIKGSLPVYVYLDSRGGDIDAAIDIGRNLRKGLGAVIITQPSVCFSACVFVLAGAPMRDVFGSVGIHRPYSTRTGGVSIEDAQREYTRLSRLSKTYLSEMNMPEELYEAMVRTPPEELRILDEHELANFGLNKIDPVLQEVQDSYQAKLYNLTKQEYLHRKALSNQICASAYQIGEQTGDFSANDSCNERVMRTGQ